MITSVARWASGEAYRIATLPFHQLGTQQEGLLLLGLWIFFSSVRRKRWRASRWEKKARCLRECGQSYSTRCNLCCPRQGINHGKAWNGAGEHCSEDWVAVRRRHRTLSSAQYEDLFFAFFSIPSSSFPGALSFLLTGAPTESRLLFCASHLL